MLELVRFVLAAIIAAAGIGLVVAVATLAGVLVVAGSRGSTGGHNGPPPPNRRKPKPSPAPPPKPRR